ncbi:MAG TPA: alpha/beta hydrolase [Balneolales bacterium]|nr:alpha/beta hydrolase [Balneolales bacterium]
MGKSTGNLRDVTIQRLAKDVHVIVNHLEKRSDINKNKIGLLGHSEGGDVAVNLAVKDPHISFLVLMSAPAYPGSDIILQQIKTLNSKMGVPASKIQGSLNMEENVIKVVKTNSGWKQLKKI